MLTNDQIAAQLKHCLTGTDFTNLGERYAGKVRDNYTRDGKRILITTDRLSAFDRIITLIPFKGQVLNALTKYWSEVTKDIVGNHVIEIPDPNVVVAEECKPLSVEMVVRGYITGTTSTSIWTHYKNGSRDFCGNKLPDGMRKDQKLPEPILTPSTKAAHGDHDESVSPDVLLERGAIAREEWDQLADVSLRLFKLGQETAAKQGVILVDTKYEFGRNSKGEIVLIDEIHTPDSSRFWIAGTYEKHFEEESDQDNINKEFLRIWLADKGFTGDSEVPEIPDEIKIETAKKYIEAFESITGQAFEGTPGDPMPRIEANLRKYMS